MIFNDPTKFEEYLAPVGGNVVIRPATGSLFNAEICIKKLERVGLFSVTANSFKAVKEPREDIYGLTIPLGAPFTISNQGRDVEYQSSTAHLLPSGHAFDLTAKEGAHFLVSIFFADSVNKYTQKLLQSDSINLSLAKPDIRFTRAGYDLLRSVARAWSVLNNKLPANEISLREHEDDLLASFVLHASNEMRDKNPVNDDIHSGISHAEDFICDNLKNSITRDQLAEVSGHSIRTLSRSFAKKYGVGPMAFIKQRRLDAAYLDFLRAEPESTTVTQIAIDYGFAHIGKFAIEYGSAYSELPSITLARG